MLKKLRAGDVIRQDLSDEDDDDYNPNCPIAAWIVTKAGNGWVMARIYCDCGRAPQCDQWSNSWELNEDTYQQDKDWLGEHLEVLRVERGMPMWRKIDD